MESTQPVTTDVVAARLLAASLGAVEVFSIHLGDRLGWYRALAEGGPATPGELVARAGGDERYAREWLEQQGAIGLLTVDGEGDGRRFALGPAEAEVLTDPSSLAHLAPLARMLSAAASALPALVEAYRSGGGVGWAEFGPDMRESQADMNRPWYEHALAPALAGVPDIHALLSRDGARIADVGAGGGWSTIALARAYPGARVTGYDVDAPSVELARRNAVEAGLDDRVGFELVDAAGLPADGVHDAVFAFECIHDLPHPVEVLRAARGMLRPGGCMVVMDEAVGDGYVAPADDVERLMYGFSLLICLPDGRSHPGSAATGTVLRPSTLRGYATAAGFAAVEVLPIEDFGFWRFYRLVP